MDADNFSVSAEEDTGEDRHGDVIFMETGRQRKELAKAMRREERRWQEHNRELAKEHHRELAKAMRCQEGRWQEHHKGHGHAEKGTDKDAGKHTSEDTGKGKGKVKPKLDLWVSGGSGSYQRNRGPNLRQAGCPISNPWWVDPPCREPSPQHERAEGGRGQGSNTNEQRVPRLL
jgi:hypothetical protein